MPRINHFLLLLFCFPGLIWASLVFSKNGQAAFILRDDGTVYSEPGFYPNATDAPAAGEIRFDKSGVQRLWTKVNSTAGEEVRFSGNWNTSSAMPATGVLFSLNGVTKQAISNAGDLYSKQIVKLQVASISFNWDNTGASNDALNIRNDAATTLPVPEYQKNSSSYPAAYIKSTAISIKVKFTVTPSTITSLRIIGLPTGSAALSSTIASDVNFTNGVADNVQILVSGNTPSYVSKADVYWKWCIIDGQSLIPCETTGPHRIYTILGTPQSPWNQIAGNSQNPWVTALDFAIDPAKCNMINATAFSSATSNAAQYLFNSFGLHYDTKSGAPKYHFNKGINLTAYMNKANANIVNCYDQASAIATMSALIGGTTMYRFMGPFGYLPPTNLIGVGQCNNPFYDSPSCDPALKGMPLVGNDDTRRTRFGNHAFMKMSGNIFDACGGPHLGTESEQTYVDVAVDRSTATEASAAGSIGSITDDALTTVQ